MKTEKIFQRNKNLILLSIIFICFSTIFIPFLNVIAASIVTAYFAYPLFKKLQKKFNDTFSMVLTWISIFLVIIIPIFIVGIIGFNQAKTIINQTKDFPKIVEKIIQDPEKNEYIKWSLDKIEKYDIDIKEITKNMEEKVKKTGEIVIIKTGEFIKGLPFFIIKIIMYIFITTSLILNGIKIKEVLRKLSPIDSKTFDIYTKKIKYMTDGIMKGNFIVAAIQAVMTTLSFIIVGIPYAGVIFIISFLLYIPMIGTVIFYIPATIYLIIKGKYIAAILIFLWNSVAVANVDNIFRGNFVAKEARINNTLMFISILSGIVLFGFMGVLYGPLLAVIGVTSIKLYLELKEKK